MSASSPDPARGRAWLRWRRWSLLPLLLLLLGLGVMYGRWLRLSPEERVVARWVGELRRGRPTPATSARLRESGESGARALAAQLGIRDSRLGRIYRTATGYLPDVVRERLPRAADRYTRSVAASLGLGCHPQAHAAVPVILSVLEDPAAPNRAKAAELLSRFVDDSDRSQLDRMIALCRDPDPSVRSYVVVAVARWAPSEPAAMQTVVALGNDQVSTVREAANAMLADLRRRGVGRNP